MRVALSGLSAVLFSCAFLPGQEPKLPPSPAPAVNPLVSRIALGSCASQNRPMPVLNTVVDQKPELFIFLGDNIYGDTRDMSLLKSKYGALEARQEFQNLRTSVPIIATWDDHDYGENDAGKEYPFKSESKEIFLEFWNEPVESPRRRHSGIYTSYLFEDPAAGKRLQIILLDTRTFRDRLSKNTLSSWKNAYHPDTDPSKTFLGEDQWSWLRERLLEKADLRIIGSSIQFGHEYNGWESWTNLPHEMIKMVDLIKETEANGVVFVSGDVHWGELSILKPRDCYPLHDLTASGINQQWDVLEPNQNRHGDACMDHHFGMIEIDWTTNDPGISFRIHDATGKTRVSKTVQLSELSFSAK
ncbi:MAG: alkaline phosphatase D family protein [Aureliella sp.]